MGTLRWIATIACDGGPVIAADARAFARWRGAAPIVGTQKTLHVWGQFTAALPERFHPSGEAGHQFVDCGTHEGARAMLDDLVKTVVSTWPGTEIARDPLGVQLTRPDGRFMRAELAPSSEYDAACERGDGVDAWPWEIEGRPAVLWEVEGGGVVDIAIDDANAEIVLLRTWVDADEGEDAARALVAAPDADEKTELSLDVPTGALVVAWAPTACGDLVDAPDADSLAVGQTRSLSSGAIEDVAAVLRIEPGRYVISTGTRESEDEADDGDESEPWSARWCRLRRV